MSSTPFYESNDLIIRPYRSDDAASLAFYSNNKLIASQMEPWFASPFTYDDACCWVAENIDGQNFPVIFYGDVIGNVGLRNVADGKAEIMVWLAPDFWGKGIASRACNWIAEYASNLLSIKTLTAKIKSGNSAAIAIAEKLGINYTNWQ